METKVISFRVSESEKDEMKDAQERLGFPNMSQFILYLLDRYKREVKK